MLVIMKFPFIDAFPFKIKQVYEKIDRYQNQIVGPNEIVFNKKSELTVKENLMLLQIFYLEI